SGSSPLSLRQAIINSNGHNPGAGNHNTINFSIGSVGSQQTITLSSTLASITMPVLIDGLSQGGSGNTTVLISIDGTSAGSGVDGFTVASGAPTTTVSGLFIKNFTGAGVSVGGGVTADILTSILSANAKGVLNQGGSNCTV